MNIEYLKSFMVVAEMLNFTKAAQILHMSQPTLSKQIKVLEKRFNAELFERDTHNVALTPAGLTLLEQGKNILRNFEQLETDVLVSKDYTKGVVRIASVDYYSKKLFDFILDYRQENPSVQINIRHQRSSKCMEQLRSGEIDLALNFSFIVGLSDKEFSMLKIDRSKFYLICNPKHRFAQLSAVSPEELAKESNLQVDPIMFHALLSTHCFDMSSWTYVLHNADLRQEGRISAEEVLLLVRSGESIALMPGCVAKQQSDGYKMVNLFGVETDFDVMLIWKKRQTNPHVRRFLAKLEDLYKNDK